jgi:hypothetical protein
MNIFLTTFPRSGSWLFAKSLYQKTGFPINKFHWKVVSDLTTISIVRDPIETILSKVAMETEDKKYELTKENAQNIINEYVNFYKYIEKNISIIIDYRDLVFNLDETILKISKLMGLKPLKDPIPVDEIIDHPEIGHWVSSKSLGNYDKISNMVKDLDFTGAYKIYIKLLDKCI